MPARARLTALVAGTAAALVAGGRAELRSVGFGGRIEVHAVEVDGDHAIARVDNVRGKRRVAGATTLRKVGDEWLLDVAAR